MASSSVIATWSRELESGLVALRAGDFASARARFERAYQNGPDQPLVQYALGRELARHGEFAQAKALLRSAWLSDSTLIGAAATLARGLGLEEGAFDEAEALLDEACDSTIETATLEIVRAELSIERGDFRRAREAADRATDDDDSEVVALGAAAVRVRADNLEGIALAAANECEAALFCFRRAQVGDPHWAAPRLNSALAFESLGRIEPALSAVDAALELDGDNAEAIALRARLLFRGGRGNEATSGLASAIASHPETPELAMMLAEICAAGGDVETASSILTDLLAQDPTDAQAWLTLGRAQLSAGAIGAAEECLRQAAELDPANPDILTLLADLLVRDGRFAEAAAIAQKAQSLATKDASRYDRRDDSSRTRPNRR